MRAVALPAAAAPVDCSILKWSNARPELRVGGVVQNAGRRSELEELFHPRISSAVNLADRHDRGWVVAGVAVLRHHAVRRGIENQIQVECMAVADAHINRREPIRSYIAPVALGREHHPGRPVRVLPTITSLT